MIDFAFPNMPLPPSFMGKWRMTLNTTIENESEGVSQDCVRYFADLADTMYGG